jgi:hypothetical protein
MDQVGDPVYKDPGRAIDPAGQLAIVRRPRVGDSDGPARLVNQLEATDEPCKRESRDAMIARIGRGSGILVECQLAWL